MYSCRHIAKGPDILIYSQKILLVPFNIKKETRSVKKTSKVSGEEIKVNVEAKDLGKSWMPYIQHVKTLKSKYTAKYSEILDLATSTHRIGFSFQVYKLHILITNGSELIIYISQIQ